jgi:hypothetical protein
MSFDLCNRLLKTRESIKTPTSKVGAHLGMCGFFSLTFSYIPGSMKSDSRASLLARTFASLCLGREPEAKVATLWTIISHLPHVTTPNW